MLVRASLLVIMTFFASYPLSNGYALARLGDFKGNGGDVVTCTDGQVTVLDVFESQLTSLPRKTDLESLYFVPLELAGQTHLAAMLRAQASSFIDDAVMMTSDLGNVVDEGDHLPLPAHCQLEQIANQNPSLLPFGKRYIVNKRLWDKLDPLNRTALIFHELLYSLSQNPSSKELRALNRSLLEGRIALWTPYQLFDNLKNAGLPIFTRQGFPIAIDASAKWQNTQGQLRLSEGTAVQGEHFTVCGQTVVLEQHHILFSSAEERPRGYWIKGEVTCPLTDGRTVQVATDFWGQADGIELFDNGSLHRVPVSLSERQSFLPEIPKARAKRLTFNPEGEIVAVTANDADFSFGSVYHLQIDNRDLDFQIGKTAIQFAAPYPATITLQNQTVEIKMADLVVFDFVQNSLQFTASRALRLKDQRGQTIAVSAGQRLTIDTAGQLRP
ncbi:MAG: hypothetical protein JNJ49_16135 [Bdellovibrionaceae bacterium]|nr:hypothetical protein [Pseudobdellovibrionaceae bacterium]